MPQVDIVQATFCPYGMIYPCPECVGDKLVAIGTFYPEFEVYEDRVEGWANRDIIKIPKCRECETAMFCGGGWRMCLA